MKFLDLAKVYIRSGGGGGTIEVVEERSCLLLPKALGHHSSE